MFRSYSFRSQLEKPRSPSEAVSQIAIIMFEALFGLAPFASGLATALRGKDQRPFLAGRLLYLSGGKLPARCTKTLLV